MQRIKDIGGYIELDFGKNKTYHKGALALNLARNCIKYIIESYNINEIWVPSYTCPVVWQTIEKTKCKINFYDINEDFLPETNFAPDDFILYTNYFGICSEKVKLLANKYSNLIVDNAQAFYMEHKGLASVYSPRKFFGVPDGGYLYCNKFLNTKLPQDKNSHARCSHLLKRIEDGPNFGYKDFNKTEDLLSKEPIMKMSNLTKHFLDGINYDQAKKIRLRNFYIIQDELSKYNELKFEITDDIPMYYPFLIQNSKLRKILLANNIYIPQCWRGLDTESYDKNSQLSQWKYYLFQYMHPLIIDQRYDEKDMKKIINIVRSVI